MTRWKWCCSELKTPEGHLVFIFLPIKQTLIKTRSEYRFYPDTSLSSKISSRHKLSSNCDRSRSLFEVVPKMQCKQIPSPISSKQMWDMNYDYHSFVAFVLTCLTQYLKYLLYIFWVFVLFFYSVLYAAFDCTVLCWALLILFKYFVNDMVSYVIIVLWIS